MSAHNDGGPAFPVDAIVDAHGMTLRDYFAAKAMAALIAKSDKDGANCGPKAVPKLARFAYEYADAMLAERAK